MRLRAALHRLQRDGFALLPGIPRSTADRLCALLNRVARRGPTAAERPLWVMERDLAEAKRDGLTLPANRDAVFILGEPLRLSPLFGVAVAFPPLIDAVAATLRTPRLAFHFTNVTAKAARFGSGIGWHRDAENRYVTTRRQRYLRLLICLDAMGPGNGGTAFRPGSHRGPGRAERTPRCAAGTVLLVDPRTLHGSKLNASLRPRRLLVVQLGRRDDPVTRPNRERLTGRSPRLIRRGGHRG